MADSGICYIIGAGTFVDNHFMPGESDYVIAADGGLKYLEERKCRPDLVVGDFDSYGSIPDLPNLVRHPVQKDDTDMELAMALGYEKGYRRFHLYGACGGRVDHTIANVQMASGYADRGCDIYLFGEGYTCLVSRSKEIHFTDAYQGIISVFALSPEAEGITLKGLEYPLNEACLKNTDPIGVSNSFQGKEAQILMERGKLLVLWYQNEDKNLPTITSQQTLVL